MTISVIIPTFNEAAHIAQVVADVRTFGQGRIADILVADAASTDNTCGVARQAGANVLTCPKPGRAAQMNYAARQATGSVLYFVHADVKINPDFVADIEQALRNHYEAGCYRFRFDSPHPMLRLNSFGTRFPGLMSRGGDQTLFITRSLFDRLGGFSERYVIMEDFDMIVRIRRQARFCIIPKDVIVSARKYETNSWFRVQIANLTAFLMFYLNIAPSRIAHTYKQLLNYR
ncbi:TIGR04283 family arsenosugar biosynthesis glycosyltransferase [Nibrella viscosa]|uniref:TIGR04283 family arsenosugar biosynthesis glycosyltransferase n=1 Tax=Nibrella viscosa TaxID=1084524 RepID=A0ABP8KIR1_9BACT